MVPVTNTGKKKKILEPVARKFGYTEEALSNALSDIRGNILGIRAACRHYGVPRATVQDRLSGRVPEQRRKIGPDPKFGFEGEKKIVNWIIELAKSGIPINKYDLLDTVDGLAKDLGINHCFPGGKPGIRWYLSFLKRHPNISIREPEAINKAREAIKETSIRKWFADLHIFLAEKDVLDILDDPCRILNADETGVSLSPKSGKVLAPKGYKNVYIVKKGNEKENLTVLVVMTASGEICPPLVVFPYLRPPKVVVDNMPPDWILGKSETGWMRADIFFEYMSNGFHDWLTIQNVKRPVLFLVDGHKSHMSMPLSKFCEDNGIILYALPPNTTHILQPADVSVFKPLKQEWKRTVKNWQSRPENLNKCITKTNFCQVFKETLNMEMTETIKNGFRKCGLYPFDVEQVDFSKCVKDAQTRNAMAAQTNSEKPLNERHFEIAKKVFYLMEENIAKLGINPSIIIREIDRTKDSYLQNRRSKSKTPRTSQSTPRHSKSYEVNKSSTSVGSSSTPRQTKSSEKNPKSHRPNSSVDNSVQLPDIGSFVSLDDISITPFNDINLSDIVIPLDIAIDDDTCTETSVKGNQINTVELIQDFATAESATNDKDRQPNSMVYVGVDENIKPLIKDSTKKITIISDVVIPKPIMKPPPKTTNYISGSSAMQKLQIETVDEIQKEHKKIHLKLATKEFEFKKEKITTGTSFNTLLNESLNVSPDKKHTCSKGSDKENNPPVISQDDTLETSTTSDKILASSALKINHSNAIKQDESDSITLKEKQSIYSSTIHPSTESFNTTCQKKSKTTNKIKDVNILPAIDDDREDPFQKHLKFPSVVTKNKGNRSSGQFPSAIASKAWQQYHENKEKEKQNKENKIKKRKLERELKRKEPPQKKKRTGIKTAVIKKKKVEETQSRIKCSSCDFDLISDTEEEGDKNIGCDQCIRWYHLKCTNLKNLSYNQAAAAQYECELCKSAESARREVLKMFNN